MSMDFGSFTVEWNDFEGKYEVYQLDAETTQALVDDAKAAEAAYLAELDAELDARYYAEREAEEALAADQALYDSLPYQANLPVLMEGW